MFASSLSSLPCHFLNPKSGLGLPYGLPLLSFFPASLHLHCVEHSFLLIVSYSR